MMGMKALLLHFYFNKDDIMGQLIISIIVLLGIIDGSIQVYNASKNPQNNDMNEGDVTMGHAYQRHAFGPMFGPNHPWN